MGPRVGAVTDNREITAKGIAWTSIMQTKCLRCDYFTCSCRRLTCLYFLLDNNLFLGLTNPLTRQTGQNHFLIPPSCMCIRDNDMIKCCYHGGGFSNLNQEIKCTAVQTKSPTNYLVVCRYFKLESTLLYGISRLSFIDVVMFIHVHTGDQV